MSGYGCQSTGICLQARGALPAATRVPEELTRRRKKQRRRQTRCAADLSGGDGGGNGGGSLRM